MPFRAYLNDEKAMTLIEVVVGIAILTLALIPILGAFTSNTKFVGQSKERSQALFLARQVMEEVRNVASDETFTDTVAFETALQNQINYASSWNGFDTNNDGNCDVWNQVVIPNDFSGSNYSAKVCYADTASQDLKEVKVKVEWDNGSKSIELTSLIRRR